MTIFSLSTAAVQSVTHGTATRSMKPDFAHNISGSYEARCKLLDGREAIVSNSKEGALAPQDLISLIECAVAL
jgi:hypothetical protein